MTPSFSVRNNIKQTAMPEVNCFEIHGECGVVRFDVILEDAKVKKTPMKRVSTFGGTTLEDIKTKLQVRNGIEVLKQLLFFAREQKNKEKS